jgi:hypothetical protein
MGAAASILGSEGGKPIDASDITDFDAAKAEVIRLRQIFAEKIANPGVSERKIIM